MPIYGTIFLVRVFVADSGTCVIDISFSLLLSRLIAIKNISSD